MAMSLEGRSSTTRMLTRSARPIGGEAMPTGYRSSQARSFATSSSGSTGFAR